MFHVIVLNGVAMIFDTMQGLQTASEYLTSVIVAIYSCNHSYLGFHYKLQQLTLFVIYFIVNRNNSRSNYILQ